MSIFGVPAGLLAGNIVKYATPGKLGETWANNAINPDVDTHGNAFSFPNEVARANPNDPNSPLTSVSNPYSGQVLGVNNNSAAAAPAVDPQAAAFYDDQLRRGQQQIDLLDPQFNVGRDNILNSYTSARNDLTGQQARATRDYTTNRGNTISDQEAAKQQIDTGVRQNTTAIQRLLGRAGSGNSSAAQVAAPFAAGRAGSQQRSQVQQQYGRNLQALDTNYGDTQNQFTSAFGDLDRQRDTNVNQLQAKTNETRSRLLETLASLSAQKGQAQGQTYQQARSAAQPFLSQADALYGQAADLGRQYANPVIQAAPVTYQAPTLDAYNYDRVAPASSDSPAYADQINPYGFLFGRDRRGAAF